MAQVVHPSKQLVLTLLEKRKEAALARTHAQTAHNKAQTLRITCTQCSKERTTHYHSLLGPKGWRRIWCKGPCRKARVSKKWNSACGMLWHKCALHAHGTSKSRQSLPHVTATPAHACLSLPTAPCRPKEPSKVTEPEGHTHPALQPAQAERQHTLTPLALALTRHEPLHTRHCTSPCLPNELSSASAHTASQTALPQPHHETPQPLHDPTTTLGPASKGKPKRAKGVSHVRARLPLALASLRITLPPPPDRSAVTAPPLPRQ